MIKNKTSAPRLSIKHCRACVRHKERGQGLAQGRLGHVDASEAVALVHEDAICDALGAHGVLDVREAKEVAADEPRVALLRVLPVLRDLSAAPLQRRGPLQLSEGSLPAGAQLAEVGSELPQLRATLSPALARRDLRVGPPEEARPLPHGLVAAVRAARPPQSLRFERDAFPHQLVARPRAARVKPPSSSMSAEQLLEEGRAAQALHERRLGWAGSLASGEVPLQVHVGHAHLRHPHPQEGQQGRVLAQPGRVPAARLLHLAGKGSVQAAVGGLDEAPRLGQNVGVPHVDQAGEGVLGALVAEDEAPVQLPGHGHGDLPHELHELRLVAVALVDDGELPRTEGLSQKLHDGAEAVHKRAGGRVQHVQQRAALLVEPLKTVPEIVGGLGHPGRDRTPDVLRRAAEEHLGPWDLRPQNVPEVRLVGVQRVAPLPPREGRLHTAGQHAVQENAGRHDRHDGAARAPAVDAGHVEDAE
eukprot:1874355-Lingulodinium_polyedra.AAC.2